MADSAETVKADALAWPERAAALKVVDTESYTGASEMLKGIKALRNKIAEVFDKHIKAAHEAHKGLGEGEGRRRGAADHGRGAIAGVGSRTGGTGTHSARGEKRLGEIARQAEEKRRLEEAAAVLEAEALED